MLVKYIFISEKKLFLTLKILVMLWHLLGGGESPNCPMKLLLD